MYLFHSKEDFSFLCGIGNVKRIRKPLQIWMKATSHIIRLYFPLISPFISMSIRTSCMKVCGLGDAKCTQGGFWNQDEQFPSGGSNDIWLTSGSKCGWERPGLEIALTRMDKCSEWMGWNKMANQSSRQVTAAGWKNQTILTTFKRM